MKKRILTSFLAAFLSISLVINCVCNSNELKYQKNSTINNLFVLGDSLSDTGSLCEVISEFGNNLEQFYQKNRTFTGLFLDNNDNNRIEEVIKYFSNFILPKDYYKCSFSNGPVAAQIFAKKLGIELSCGYKIDYSINWPLSHKFSINKKGNNYAVAGSKSNYRNGLLESLSSFSLPSAYQSEYKHLGWKEWILQIIEDVFLNLVSIKKQTDALIEHHKINSNDLFFIEIGGNDLFSVYEKIRSKLYDKNINLSSLIEKQTASSIYNLKESLEKLLKKGAKKIMLANCVNIAHTPFANNLNEKNKNILETITNSFNSKWNNMFNDFKHNYPSIFKKVDFNFICNELLAKFHKQGFNITDPIADYNVENFTEIIFGGSRTPIINAKSKEEKDKYFFFDLIHPSAKFHLLLAEELYKIYQTWNNRIDL